MLSRRPAAAAASRLASRSLSAASTMTPLDVPLEGVPALRPASEQVAPTTRSTTLGNGLKIVSQEDYGQAASLGLFVDAGSAFETDANAGVSHFCEHLAFKSSKQRSSLRIVRDVELFGGSTTSNSSREYAQYQIDALRPHLSECVSTLAECVAEPKLAKWDVDDAREVVGWELDHFETDALTVCNEVVHAAAFGEEDPLGRSLWCPRRNLNSINAQTVEEFQSDLWVGNNMVLAAAGVDHDRLVDLVSSSSLAKMRAGTKAVRPKSVYRGGERRVKANEPFTHVTLAFDADKGWNSSKLIPLCVLHMLLGGGSAFSAGGPGKGMYSRLYTNVLNKKHWVDSCQSFNSMFNDNGLLGVQGTCPAEYAGEWVRTVAEELNASKSKLTNEEVSRAKNQLKSSVLINLESRVVLQEDIGRQVLSYGEREDPSSLIKKIAACSKADVQKAAASLLKSAPSLAAYGDTAKIPSYDEISNMFK